MDTAGARTFLYDFGKQAAEAAFGMVGIEPVLRYAGDTSGANKEPPPDDQYWARISRTIVDERQETLRCATKRYVTNGLAYVELYAPRSDSKAQVTLDTVAELIRNEYRRTQGAECEFTTAEINDSVAAEPAWLRANVVSNYQFRQFIS